MKIFLIQADNAYFGSSYKDPEQRRAVRNSEREDIPVRGMAELIGWYYSGNEKEEPIFTDFGYLGSGTELILRPPRTEVVRPMLLQVGTIVPMTPWKGHKLEAFICETKLDALDPERMVYAPDDGHYSGTEVVSYAFRPEAVATATVFRVSGLLGRLFATERFIGVVEAHGLTGLQVLPVWSDEKGPLVVFDDPDDEFRQRPARPGDTRAERRARMRAILAKRDETA